MRSTRKSNAMNNSMRSFIDDSQESAEDQQNRNQEDNN